MIKERKRLGDILVESGLISKEQLEWALAEKKDNEKLGNVLLKEGLITEQQLIEALEFQLGIPHVNIHQYQIEEEALKAVPKEIAKRHEVMPIRKEENKLFVAMADPLDYFAIEELRMVTGAHIVPAITTRDALYQTITKYYDLQESLDEVLDEYIPEQTIDETGIMREDSPVVRLVNQLIENAINQRASDIHLDPQENEVRVRYRIDGILRTDRFLPKRMQNIIIARLKIMANLNITESRMPQDGRMKLTIHFKPVDIRISTLPSVYGEKIVMRILDLSQTIDQIDRLGLTEENKEEFTKMILRPSGIVLITGPTGSGKSSTMYAALNTLNSEDVNIITIEDPVEYQLEGINQIQVNEEIGMTFANGLRSILRQDPDIIMVGEIRDLETAQIAIRASLTGHLVLSTLHTNSAVETLTRLVDMGIEPYLISSSLSGIVAQRLVRRICLDCKEDVEPTLREREIFEKFQLDIQTLYKGAGCVSCSQTGYRGRIAIHEILPVNDQVKDYVMQTGSASLLREYIRKEEIPSLIEDGLKKVRDGLTTTEEVLRVAMVE